MKMKAKGVYLRAWGHDPERRGRVNLAATGRLPDFIFPIASKIRWVGSDSDQLLAALCVDIPRHDSDTVTWSLGNLTYSQVATKKSGTHPAS